MNDKEREAWNMCLAIWEYIKDNAEDLIEANGFDIQDCKYDAIHELSLDSRMLHDCPMCEAFKYCQGYEVCELCPISINEQSTRYACLHCTRYGELDNDYPDPEGFEAQINGFYEYLVELAKRRGYYDSPDRI